MDQTLELGSDDELVERLRALIDERLDIESLASRVEHLDFSNRLNEKLTTAFGELRGELSRVLGEVRDRILRNQHLLAATQMELRDLMLDVALLKRAAVTVGHVGVLEKRKIERELVLELLPPARTREGMGVQTVPAKDTPPRRVDCENRLHLCKAACCRLFEAPLTVYEVESGRFDWDPRRPYTLRRERTGCVHLKGGTCTCTIYHDRPQTCRNYSCENDRRIWSDFANMVLNPTLAQQLERLDVVVQPAGANVTASSTIETITPRESATPERQVEPASPPVTPPPPKVAPPNFDDLRELIVPRPNKVFIPPRQENGPPSSESIGK